MKAERKEEEENRRSTGRSGGEYSRVGEKTLIVEDVRED